MLISPDDPDGMLRHADECRSAATRSRRTPPSSWPGWTAPQIRAFVDGRAYLFSNDYEWELMRRRPAGPRPTCWSGSHPDHHPGEKGVEIVGRAGRCSSGACPRRSRPTRPGVGDAFRAGSLRASKGPGAGARRAARFLIAVFVLETVGPQDWTLDRAQALARLGDAYGPDAADEIAAIVPA